MELGFALTVLSPEPEIIDEQVVISSSVAGAGVIPLAFFDEKMRAHLLLHRRDAPLALRVKAALDVEAFPQAWRLVRQSPGGPTVDLGMASVLRNWSSRQLSSWKLPDRDESVILLSNFNATRYRLAHRNVTGALSDVEHMTSSLSWPLWLGPLVVRFPDSSAAAPLKTAHRPAAPVVVLPKHDPDDLRAVAAKAILQLVLDLQGNDKAWPAWLRIGLTEVAAAKARGEGPSPRGMLSIRRKAGPAAIKQLFTSDKPDPELAKAVCAPLCHTNHRQHLGSLLDLLRNNTDALTALGIAYKRDLNSLLSRR